MGELRKSRKVSILWGACGKVAPGAEEASLWGGGANTRATNGGAMLRDFDACGNVLPFGRPCTPTACAGLRQMPHLHRKRQYTRADLGGAFRERSLPILANGVLYLADGGRHIGSRQADLPFWPSICSPVLSPLQTREIGRFDLHWPGGRSGLSRGIT